MSDASVRSEPQVISLTADDRSARVELHVPEDLCYFEGHFPGCAILPGVVQMKWAIEFGRRHFALPPRFAQLSNIKFMRVIVPGKRVSLLLESAGGELAFEYRIGDSVCSSGSVGFTA